MHLIGYPSTVPRAQTRGTAGGNGACYLGDSAAYVNIPRRAARRCRACIQRAATSLNRRGFSDITCGNQIHTATVAARLAACV